VKANGAWQSRHRATEMQSCGKQQLGGVSYCNTPICRHLVARKSGGELAVPPEKGLRQLEEFCSIMPPVFHLPHKTSALVFHQAPRAVDA
jgi:hypothetical protein